jgi:hypothetical protein
MTLSAVIGWNQHSTHAHLLSRLVVCTIPILPLYVFKYFNEKLSVWAVLPLHYAISLSLVMLYVFLYGFFGAIHHNAYFYMFRSFTMIYVPVVMVALAFDLHRTASVNRKLKELRDRKK